MRAIVSRILAIALLTAGLSATSWSGALAKKMTCPEPTPVAIDIRPGQFPNKVNLSSQGLLPVAVLSTGDFDASQFVPEMAHLADASSDMAGSCAGAMAVRWTVEDVNADGMPDLVFYFRIQDLDFTLSTTAATLMAHGSYGLTTIHIMGTDTVTVKG